MKTLLSPGITTCWMDVKSTLNQRLNQNSTLIQRLFNIVCLLGFFLDCSTFVMEQWLWSAGVHSISCCNKNRTRISLLHSWVMKFAHLTEGGTIILLTLIGGNLFSHRTQELFLMEIWRYLSNMVLSSWAVYPTEEKFQQKCQNYAWESLSPTVLRKKQPELDHHC
jgi:hypothetical protein